jgi:endonuclease/exonuclease/phosphatase family metal-dependent hydrolase
LELLNYVVSFGTGDGIIVMGDFNAEPEYPEIAIITQELTDAWSVTRPNDTGYTFPSDDPNERIDYIFIQPEELLSDCIVPNTTVSDHLPILCEIDIR